MTQLTGYYSVNARNGPPAVTTPSILVNIRAIDFVDMWATADAFGLMSLYFNPQAHGEESLELIAQVIEKGAYEELKKIAGGCCRVDFRFEVMTFKIRGVSVYREDCDSYKIKDLIHPGEQLSLDILQVIFATPFCCCG